MLEVAAHGEAAAVDAWSDFSEVGDCSGGGGGGTTVFGAEAAFWFAVDGGHGGGDEGSVAADNLAATFQIHGV